MAGRPRVDAAVVTCEHGGNRIPERYRDRFRDGRAALAGHRGWDCGALRLARRLAAALGAELHASTVSRLLIELNRSPHHPRLFSEFTRGLGAIERRRILDTHYRPYRGGVEKSVAGLVRGRRRVLHLSVHSFTPVLDGVRRNADLGLLYDPRRPLERAFCLAWKEALRVLLPETRVRLNYPYRGDADGFTTYLRTVFPRRAYLGIELEVNMRFFTGSAAERRRVLDAAERSLLGLVG